MVNTYAQTQRLSEDIFKVLHEIQSIPQEVYDYAPCLYSEKTLAQITRIREIVEAYEKYAVCQSARERLIPQRKLAEITQRPTSTIARWKKGYTHA